MSRPSMDWFMDYSNHKLITDPSGFFNDDLFDSRIRFYPATSPLGACNSEVDGLGVYDYS